MKTVLRYGWIALAVIALDLLTKHLAAGLTSPVVLIPGVVGLELTYNRGVAFSLLSDVPWFAALLPLPILVGGFLVLRRYRLGPLSLTAAALILGGAVSNMADRLISGQVTDMIRILAFRFAIFNIADTALCVGCLLMILSVCFRPREWERRSNGNE